MEIIISHRKIKVKQKKMWKFEKMFIKVLQLWNINNINSQMAIGKQFAINITQKIKILIK